MTYRINHVYRLNDEIHVLIERYDAKANVSWGSEWLRADELPKYGFTKADLVPWVLTGKL